MKKKSLYAALILLTINGLQAWNPFTKASNLVSGKNGCSAGLVSQIVTGPLNRTPEGLKSFGKKQQLFNRCMGTGQSPEVLGKKMARNLPNFTKALITACHQNGNFARQYRKHCVVANSAVNGNSRNVGNPRQANRNGPGNQVNPNMQNNQSQSIGAQQHPGQPCECICPPPQNPQQNGGYPPQQQNDYPQQQSAGYSQQHPGYPSQQAWETPYNQGLCQPPQQQDAVQPQQQNFGY